MAAKSISFLKKKRLHLSHSNSIVIAREHKDAIVFKSHFNNTLYRVEFLLLPNEEMKSALIKQRRFIDSRRRHLLLVSRRRDKCLNEV
jgi:hypothetical protein